MNSLQKWCKDNLHVIEASANGEVVQIKPTGCELWVDIDYPCFRGDLAYEYRVKPRTIKIGDFDVPEPMRVAPSAGTNVFSVSLELIGSHDEWDWIDGDCVMDLMLSRGILHSSRESAIAHAKALIALTAEK